MAGSSLPVRTSFSAFFRVSARSIAKDQILSNRVGGRDQRRWAAEEPCAGRAAQVSARVRVAMAGDGVEVLARRVSLVFVEAVARILAVQLQHRAVAGHLGDD